MSVIPLCETATANGGDDDGDGDGDGGGGGSHSTTPSLWKRADFFLFFFFKFLV